MSDAKQHGIDDEYDRNRHKRERLEECAADAMVVMKRVIKTVVPEIVTTQIKQGERK